MAIKEWEVKEVNKEEIIKYSEEWGTPKFLTALLCVRGFTEKEKVLDFLGENFDNCANPFDFPDMQKLVDRVNLAIKKQEKICIYADYDSDGITSAALIYSYLKENGANVIYYIPTRLRDGYGLNKAAVENLAKEGVQLIFTVDNGISANDEIIYAKNLGLDVVVTDHHRVHGSLPEATAVVDPYREDCMIEHKNYCGAGVVFKVIEAMEHGKMTRQEIYKKYSDLAALGTLGDSIELTNEARLIVKEGIKAIAKTQKPGLQALLETTGLDSKNINSEDITYGLIPRINASGRMDDAGLSVKMILSDDFANARGTCLEIDMQNTMRKSLEFEILSIVEEQLKNDPKKKYQKLIIAIGKNWHHGVLGIAASRIMSKYGKPTLLLTIEDNYIKGSSRSIQGFAINESFAASSKYLERFGGHPMAAGVTLKIENLEKFEKALLDYVKKQEIPNPKVKIDFKLNPSSIKLSIIDQIERLQPFGSGNPPPVFGIFGMKLEEIRPIGSGKHLKLTFSREDIRIEVLCFGKSFGQFLYTVGDKLDLAVTLRRNVYKKVEKISFYLEDLKFSDVDLSEYLRQKNIYEKFRRNEKLNTEEIKILKPSREDFAKLYNFFKINQKKLLRADIIERKIFGKGQYDAPKYAKIIIMLDVFEEMDLAEINYDVDEFIVVLKKGKEKVNLSESKILKKFDK